MATRFVVFSIGRSGTNFVMNNLKAHPEVRAHMEPFHGDPNARDKVEGKRWETGTSSADFAYKELWKGIKPVEGFKLFFFHCRQDSVSADIWERLRADREVKLLFINRRNLLMKHISDLRATASGVWHPTSKNYMADQYGEVVELELDIPRMTKVMTELYCSWHRVAEMFRDHEALHVDYEELAENSPPHFQRIQEFLGLEPLVSGHGFRPGTLTPQTTRIRNAAAVRNAVGKSVFCDFLKDCPLV